jgi:hypothetical protein
LIVPPERETESGFMLPGLGELLGHRITWSSDNTLVSPYKPSWPGAQEVVRGPRAGDRFDIVLENFDWEGKKWKDVSQKCVRDIFDHFSDRNYGENLSKYRDRYGS